MRILNPNIDILSDKYVNNRTKLKCKCKIDGHEWYGIYSDLSRGIGCPMCGGSLPIPKEVAYKTISEIHSGKIEVNFDNYKNVNSKITARCLIDGHEWITSYSRLNYRQDGCPVCDNKIIKIGVNDIGTTAPHLIKYFKHEDDKYKYTSGSNKKVQCVCPDCGSEKMITPHMLNYYGFSCNSCSDGVSMPNKLIYNVLKQAGVEFSVEKRIDNSMIRYDAYFKANNIDFLIEMDGCHHFEDMSRNSWDSLEHVTRNDEHKTKLAEKLGYKLIRIDCRKSNLDYVKHNVVKELQSIIDLENVNWEDVYLKSSRSILLDVCNIRSNSNNTKTPIDISNEMNNYISSVTVRKYLKIGQKLGLCHYIAKEDFDRTRNKNKRERKKKE